MHLKGSELSLPTVLEALSVLRVLNSLPVEPVLPINTVLTGQFKVCCVQMDSNPMLIRPGARSVQKGLTATLIAILTQSC